YMASMINRLLGDDIRLEVWVGAERPTICCDKGLIEQIIVNLAVNARDAMPDGGTLRIETRNVLLPQDLSGVPGVGLIPYVVIEITDTGVGMSPEVRARLFEPFFTTKEPGKGTGLGLTTVHGIVRESRGFIEVDSEPGRGTTFRIFLPIA